MYKLIPIFILLLLSCFDSAAQVQYKDFIIADKYIWALTSGGQIKLFDTADGKSADKEIYNSSGISVIGKDANGIPVIANSANELKRYNRKTNSWDSITNHSGDLYGVVFDKKNRCFGITKYGIENMDTKQVFFPTKSRNHYIRYFGTWEKVIIYTIDHQDRIWIGFEYGEWGGDLFIFNTANEKYIDPEPSDSNKYCSPVKSFFSDSSTVYYTSGLAHLFMVSGSIVKYENQKFSKVFGSNSEYSKDGKFKLEKEGEYIGPGAYNSFDHSIYFYSQHGIFKGDITKDLSKFENWENVTETKLRWESGQSNATGPAMNVKKMSIIDKTKFAILTEKDGIGLYNGTKMIMIQ